MDTLYLEYCCEVSSSYATIRLLFVQRTYPTYGKRLRGSRCISISALIPDKNKQVVSDQTCNRPHNKKYVEVGWASCCI